VKIPLILALLLVPLLGTAFADSQILSTDVGSLDVEVFIINTPSTGEINLNVNFLNKQTQNIQQHIDYTVQITNDDSSISQTRPLSHTSKGSVSIPIGFRQNGDYTVNITIQGILFQEIPTEKVSFKVSVILKDPVQHQYTTILCHQNSPIIIDSADIREHITHGDTRGECKIKSKPIVEEINVPTPEPEITETPIQETIPVPQVTISNEHEKILTSQETTNFVDLIINIMTSLFSLVYELEEDPRLQQWASDIIQDRVQKTQDKIFSQLETTQDISELKAESNKLLNPTPQITPQPQITQPTIQPQINPTITPQPQITQPTIPEPQIDPTITPQPNPVPQPTRVDIVFEHEPIPKTADDAIVKRAMQIAMTEWKKKNPEYRLAFFPQREPNIMIQWREVSLPDRLGEIGLGSFNYPELGHMEISLGAYDCNGDYILQDKYMVANTIMHEIGHGFGLKHHSNENHLMYGDDEFTQQNYDTLGLNIPKKLGENYVGQTKLNGELVSLDKEMGEYADKLEKVAEDITFFYSALEDEERYNPQRIQPKLDYAIEEHDILLTESNLVLDRFNELVPKINCFPNVEKLE